MIEALKRDIFDVDGASNLLPMPGKADVRQANPDLIGHQGSHARYSELINRELTDASNRFVAKYGSLSKVPETELKRAIEVTENRARRRILSNDPDISTRIDPKTGTKVLSDADFNDSELIG